MAAPTHDFAGASARTHYPPDLQLEVTHLDIGLRADIAGKTIEGRVRPTITARSEAREISLDAVDFEDLDVEGDDVRWRYDGQRLHLRWDRSLSPGESRTVSISYRVRDPASGLLFSSPSETDPDLPRFVATDHETERARHWLPTIDHPSVRPTVAFHLRADASLTILGPGLRESEDTHEDGTKTVHYRLDHPCPSYLTCFCIGELTRLEDGEESGIPFAYFGVGDVGSKELERTFGRSRELMRWLTHRLGVPFPYPRYYQFMVPGIGGAMENITLVSWDDRLALFDAIDQEHRQLIEQVNLHEMAHSYFGNLVVIRDFADAWLKEGWATYLECCWLADAYGQDAFDYDMWAAQRSYLEESSERYRRPIVTRHYGSSWQLFDRHLYPGGAWRIHMLRRMLGDDIFWPAVTTYLERFGGRTASTHDFQRVLEEASGRSLERFFAQWLHSAGCPKLQVRFRHEAGRVELEIEQAQVDKDAGVPVFAFDLDVTFEAQGGVSERTVRVEEQRTVVSFPMEAPPEVIRIDPAGKVLHELDFDPGEDLLSKQLAARDVRGRIQAGEGLIRTGKRRHIERIGKLFEAEPYWGVRVEWAKALGKVQTEAALEVLVELAERHDDPQSLPALLEALGQYRDSRVTSRLEARLDAGLAPRASEAVYDALGAQREAAPLQRLSEASAHRSVGAFAQAAALRALAGTRREEAVSLLLDRARTADPRVRGVAAQALGTLAKQLERRARERAVEALTDLLRADDARLRAGAAKGLVAAGAREAVPALEAYRATLPHQEAVVLDQGIAELRQGDGDLRKLHKTVEELETRVRRLRERADALERRLEQE